MFIKQDRIKSTLNAEDSEKKVRRVIKIFIAIVFTVVLAADYPELGFSDEGGWQVDGTNIHTADTNKAKVGIGVSAPKARMHIKNILNDSDVPVDSRAPGFLFELPSVIDSSNNPGPTMQWEGAGGFGKWRQYFNSGENGWALTYNAPWDYAAKRWLSADKEGLSVFMRFDVSKGDTGQNAFEIGFAPGGNGAPNWNEGAHYAFYDGKASDIRDKDSPRCPAKLLIEGRRDMDTIFALHGSVTSVDLMVSGDPVQPKLFKIRQPLDGNLNSPSKDLLVIDTTTGNVGIGTTSPGGPHKLSVVGTAGLSSGTSWTSTSDGRYKDVQAELKGTSLQKVMALRPIAYTWNSLHLSKYGENPGRKYGFIAQELQKVIPELVTQDEEGFFWYNPSGFEALLTAAVQEQEEELVSLKAELRDIKNMIIQRNVIK